MDKKAAIRAKFEAFKARIAAEDAAEEAAKAQALRESEENDRKWNHYPSIEAFIEHIESGIKTGKTK